jgi:DNA polymerase III delta subunit
LSEGAASHLRAAVGGNLSQIAVEIDKLAAAAEGDSVDVPDVERLVGIRHGETLSDWVNAVLMKEFVRAIQLLDVILAQSGMSAVRMLMALGTALIGTRLARAHLDTTNSTSTAMRAVMDALRSAKPRGVGRYGDEAKLWTDAAREWSATDIGDAIRHAYDADSDIKSTTLHDPRDTLYTMMLQLAAKETS